MKRFWMIVLLVGTGLPTSAEAAAFPWRQYAKKPASWFASDEAKRIAANVLSHQSPLGGWPKNLDTGAAPYQGDPKDLRGTFDNNATVGELRFLARMYHATQDVRYRDAVLKGFAHIFQAQYPNGGWPQFYPPGKNYHRHITYNDDCTVNLLRLMRDVADGKDFAFVPEADRARAAKAFDRGIDCILKCQIVVLGVPTAWCAQHDEVTLEPRKGRSYEHVSISGGESAGIIRLLMSLEKPSPEVVRAVNSACRWYEQVKLTGIRQVRRDGDKVIVPDKDALPLWARFYEIDTNRPIFSGRDGVIKYELAQIEAERRNGYAWYNQSGEALLREWQAWQKKHGL